jgi:hypothetical protein
MYENPDLANDATARYPLGTIRDYTDATYGPQKLMYVQFVDAVAYVAYAPLAWSATQGDAECAVTGDVSEDNGCAAGVARNLVMTANYYGWMTVRGVTPLKMNTDDDAADGDVAIISADMAANTGSDSGILLALGVVVTAVVAATDIAVVRLRGLI